MKLLFISFLATIVFNCAPPRTSVKTDDQSGTVVFKGTPSYAIIKINEKEVGKARDFDGKSSVLKLKSGKYKIELSSDGFKPLVKHIYLSDTQEIIEFQLEKL